MGIACAACHDPHGSSSESRLLRDHELCASCHAPLGDELLPSASSAVLVAGRVTLPESLGGDRLTDQAPHGEPRSTCIGCHGYTDEPGRLNHSFSVPPTRCRDCHESVSPIDPSLHDRAESILSRARARCGTSNATTTDWHGETDTEACADRVAARARYIAALVYLDGGAANHNPAFADRLLRLAEGWLESTQAESAHDIH